MEISQAAPAAGDAHPLLRAMPTPRCGRCPPLAWPGRVGGPPTPAAGARREVSGEGATHRGTEPREASGPPEALTEDDEEPNDKRYDSEDQPPVADGLIVWGGGEPSRRQPGRGAGLSPQRRAPGQAWERAARPTARSPRAGLPVPPPAAPGSRGTHSP